MRRENHFVAIGNTPWAVNTRRELAKRGRPVTRIFYEASVEGQIRMSMLSSPAETRSSSVIRSPERGRADGSVERALVGPIRPFEPSDI